MFIASIQMDKIAQLKYLQIRRHRSNQFFYGSINHTIPAFILFIFISCHTAHYLFFLLKTSRFKTMIANKNKTDKFGYEYFEKKILGKGAYGVVWLCQRVGQLAPNPFNQFFYDRSLSSQKYCAIKYYLQHMQGNEGIDFSTLRELNILLTSNHPNIAQAHEVYFHRQKVKLVMDFYIDLSDIIHEESIINDQYNKKMLCFQVTRGLAYLHENYVMHRDLKPANVFISRDGAVKIGDFGMCKEFGTPGRKFTPYVCTREYRAPELYLLTNYYTQKADIWSLGCLFYYIYTGQTLFMADSNSSVAIISKIFSITGTPDENSWVGYRKLPRIYEFQPYARKSLAKEKGLGKQISAIIEMCIQLDPKKRPQAKDLLNMQFFSQFLELGEYAILDVSHIYDRKLEAILTKA